tara:strand:+ start:1520 stop:1714 length:195 start_codon:yes stop_codon:yes gene_type:complete
MKPGELVEIGTLGEKGHEEFIFGLLIEDCPPESHTNGMHLIWVLHEGFTKWWPVSYVRKIDEKG